MQTSWMVNMWQDIVIAGVSFGFGFMLIPQVLDSMKGIGFVNTTTSGLTIVGIITFGVTFATLELWLSVAAEVVCVIMWIVIFMLGIKNKNATQNKKTKKM